MFSVTLNISTSAGIHDQVLPAWGAVIKNLSGGEKRRLDEEGAKPKRIRYRPISR